MIRQCFFPSSYRRRSKNYFKPTPEPDSISGTSFVKKLDLSCRRPVYSEKHKNSYTQNQNETFTEGDTLQLKRNELFSSKIKRKRPKLSEQKILRSKLLLHEQKKQGLCMKEIQKRAINQTGFSNKARRLGITQIKNQDWNWNWKNQRGHKINMTQRIKPRNAKQSENMIMGWDYYEDNDNFF